LEVYVWLAVFFAMAMGAGTHNPMRSLNVSGVWVADTPREIMRSVVQNGPQFTVIELTRGNGTTFLSRRQCSLVKSHKGKGSGTSNIFIIRCPGHVEQWALSEDGSEMVVRQMSSKSLSPAEPLLILRRSQMALP
jgi:hypothetical protein